MKQDGVVLDSQSFKLLLRSLILSANFHLALQILDYMEGLQLATTLTPLIYNSLLIASVRKNQLPLALSIFHKLLELDAAVDSNSIACNELLVALRKADMKVEFQQVFHRLREKKGFALIPGATIEMKDKGLLGPDLCTYNSLISVLCKLGKVKDALIVWEELNGYGHEPDEFTYTILIQGCSKTYRIDDATRIFNQMQNNGFRPGTVVYNSLLDGLFKATKNGRPEAAYTLFCDLKKKGQFVDGITYSIIVLQLCKEGQLEEALKLVEEMENRGFVVDLVTITSLLISIHKHGRWDWTERLLKHVREGDLVPSVLKWQAGMEASIKTPPSKKKDYSSMFPSKEISVRS
ncbi:Tetratricopeptide-like helical domain superfamily [Sesbania bispinosa]|nr:Tetratricopeptide-like helical domain superfamily [Sesbania bispinosa]